MTIDANRGDVPNELDDDAREGARALWNERACGELPGDKLSLEYFERVDADRFAQQSWAPQYFEFTSFAGKRVLEIGVGQGTDLARFAAGGAECYGVDITENHLEMTRRNFQARGLTVQLRKADATQLPFDDDYFDCVYSFGVLHHIPEIEKVLSEIERVLKPGGSLRIALYYKWSAFHVFSILLTGLLSGKLFRLGYAGVLARIETGADGQKVKPYVRLWSKSEVRRLLKRFESDDISIHQLFLSHVVPFFGVVRLRRYRIGRKLAELSERTRLPGGWFGWYVAARARKPDKVTSRVGPTGREPAGAS